VFAVVPLCSAGPTPECLGLIDTTLRTFAANFTTTLAQLRAAAGPDTMIIAMTYYNPLPSCRLSALAPLADNVLEGAPGFDGRLNDLIRAISAANGVAVADTYGKLAAENLVGGTDCLHPKRFRPPDHRRPVRRGVGWNRTAGAIGRSDHPNCLAPGEDLALLGAAPLAPSTYGVHHSIRNMA
jgi:hypothetical protein